MEIPTTNEQNKRDKLKFSQFKLIQVRCELIDKQNSKKAQVHSTHTHSEKEMF